MGLDIGQLLGDVGTLGVRYFKRRKKAKKLEKEARGLIESNTELAQQMFDRDLGESQWNNVRSDGAARVAQETALARLEGLSREGFTDLDRQALDQGFRQSQREEQSQRGAVMDAAARRGDASGGNALMGSLVAQQGGADRASQYSTDVGLAGRDRALNALESYGNQAGAMRGQDFGEQGMRAAGNDSFKQWATGTQMGAAQGLMNARLGQSQSMMGQAAQMQNSGNIEAVGRTIAAVYTGGASEAAMAGGGGGSGGGAPAGGSFKSGSISPTSGTGGTPWIQGSPSAAEYARLRAQAGGG